MNLLFIGNFFPKPLLETLVSDSRGKVVFSNHLYEWNVLRALAGRDEVSLRAVTVPSVGSFPKGNRSLFTKAYTGKEEGIRVEGAGFCNLWPLFVLSRERGLRRLLVRRLRRYGREHIEIVLCAPTWYSMQALNAAIRRTGADVRITIIFPDVPLIMDEMSQIEGLRGWLRRAMTRRLMTLLQAVHSYILITEQMRDFVPEGSDCLVMEGIITPPQSVDPKPVEAPIIAYTGVVDRQFGLGYLVEAFEKLTVPGAELWIAGPGPMGEELRRKAAANPAIKFFGLVSPEEAARIRAGARVLVNPRTSEGRYTRYSFPSKTLDYLASGKAVVANMLPGSPEEYRSYLIVPEREDADALAEALTAALSLSDEEYILRSQREREFILNNKTAAAQGDKIIAFLER